MDSGLLDLPSEVLLHVLSFLSYKSLASLRLACRAIAELCNDATVFRSLVQRHVFSDAETCEEGDWRGRFGELLKVAPPAGSYHIFLSLDNLPIVRRTMGMAQVFVLEVELEHMPVQPLLDGRAACLAQRTFGDAPWGRFEFVLMSWGSLLAGFSFYRGSSIHSLYLGVLREDASALGCMTSGWNDVTGSFLFRPEEPFKQNVRENAWGDAFCDYHLHRSDGTTVPVYAVSGGTWSMRGRVLGEDEEGETACHVTIHVDWQARGAFVGHGFGSWRLHSGATEEKLWRMRGCQEETALCMLLEEEDANLEQGCVSLMLLGTIAAGLRIQGRFVVDETGAALRTGFFECSPSKWIENPADQ